MGHNCRVFKKPLRVRWLSPHISSLYYCCLILLNFVFGLNCFKIFFLIKVFFNYFCYNVKMVFFYLSILKFNYFYINSLFILLDCMCQFMEVHCICTFWTIRTIIHFEIRQSFQNFNIVLNSNRNSSIYILIIFLLIRLNCMCYCIELFCIC